MICLKEVDQCILTKENVIKVFDDIVDIFDQEIIKHQVFNETYFQYVDDVSIKNNQHQRRPGFKHIFDVDILHNSINRDCK